MSTTTRLFWPNGDPILWKREEYDPTQRVLWSKRTTGGKIIQGSLRTIAFFDRLDRLARKRFGQGLLIFQGPYNTTVAASAGTHDFDALMDWWIPGVPGWTQQKFARANGAMNWFRYPPTFGKHQHGGPVPPQRGTLRRDDFADNGFKVGIYVPGQLEDYYEHKSGLSGHAHDPSWHPPSIRETIFNLNAYIERRRAEQERR